MILKAAADRRDQDYERARTLNYEMAALVSFAHHDPRKMPKYKPLKSKDAAKDDALAQAQARGALIALSMRQKG